MIPQAKLNLFLIFSQSRFNIRDVAEIGSLVMRKAPDILVHVVSPHSTADNVSKNAWRGPALTVSLAGGTGKFIPSRGPILFNQPLSKFEQHRRLTSAGLNTPHTAKFQFGESYHEDDWSEFVVLKPANLKMTSKGKNVRLMRTRRLHQISQQGPNGPDSAKMKDTIVQQFIDSGELATFWRPMTLFGRTLYCMKSWSPIPRPALTAPDEEIEAAIIEPKQAEVVSKFKVSEMRALEHDPEVVELARKVHATVPNYPLLGCDIIREISSGKLFVIEMNAGGNVWHFSSRRAALGLATITREDRIKQYGAWDIAADSLIEKTRALAC